MCAKIKTKTRESLEILKSIFKYKKQQQQKKKKTGLLENVTFCFYSRKLSSYGALVGEGANALATKAAEFVTRLLDVYLGSIPVADLVGLCAGLFS